MDVTPLPLRPLSRTDPILGTEVLNFRRTAIRSITLWDTESKEFTFLPLLWMEDFDYFLPPLYTYFYLYCRKELVPRYRLCVF